MGRSRLPRYIQAGMTMKPENKARAAERVTGGRKATVKPRVSHRQKSSFIRGTTETTETTHERAAVAIRLRLPVVSVVSVVRDIYI